jgi:hypothetical protein
MNFKSRVTQILEITGRLIRYNLRIVFGNKFFLFCLAAVLFFLLVVVINLFSDTNPTAGTVYALLLLPGLLLIFYPTTFGIQHDTDTRMIEIIFGIPNYRYKVWLVRLALIYGVVFLILLILSLLCVLALLPFPVLEMVYHLMFPIFFLGSLAFFFSTLIRNGNGTAVVMVVIGLVFWISSGILEDSKWNIFLNPFRLPENMREEIWVGILLQNRIIILVGTVIALLWGLLNLQKREKFI